ncbi:MAG TPA: ZIP family metal transporter [Blastocatellia bacterium]|nr:ZIP family metal transporter [Blastocatellia bacterium]
MGKSTLIILAYGVAAAAATVVGGLLVSARRLAESTLRYLIALGAGFMLATVFLKIVPESLSQWPADALTPMLWLLGGYMLIHLVEHTVAPHFHFGEETHEEAMLAQHAALAGLGALMVHAFFDGVSIAVASLINVQLGILVFVAIMLHKLPEGFTVASMMQAAGRSGRRSVGAALLIGVTTTAGVVLVILAQNVAMYSRPISAFVLPLSAGVTLYVAASDLIPEINARDRRAMISLMVFAGVALLYLIELILDALPFARA